MGLPLVLYLKYVDCNDTNLVTHDPFFDRNVLTIMVSSQKKSTLQPDILPKRFALELIGLNKSFSQGGVHLEILKDINFSLNKGELVALLGPSGSGKSTLLQIAGLLDKADSGSIIIGDQDVTNLNDQKQTLIRRMKIGFVYQFHHLLPEFSAIENLVIPQMIGGCPKKDALAKAEEMLAKLNLSDRASHRPARLSGGEQQRIAIGRALINDPDILLADEPTGNLDPETSKLIFDLLVDIVRERNVAGFIATHNINLADKMDRVCELKDGSIRDK